MRLCGFVLYRMVWVDEENKQNDTSEQTGEIPSCDYTVDVNLEEDSPHCDQFCLSMA